ncbi:MAG TPA: hypothetical protein VMM77_01985 [Gemmatimonadaceae bacterium]|nr:hypothetical protein [Gemmatimonadaceae bacterium]
MISGMRRRPSFQVFLIALLALQFLAGASTALAAGAAAPADCEGMHGPADDCPCCPDFFGSAEGCATLCLAGSGLPPDDEMPFGQAARFDVPRYAGPLFASRDSPPDNPPPIR